MEKEPHLKFSNPVFIDPSYLKIHMNLLKIVTIAKGEEEFQK